MSGALFNALCLAAAALAATWLLYRRIASGSSPPEEHLPAGADLRALLKARYAAKAWFRAGVLVCSGAALAVYLGGGGRVIPLLLLCGAAACQYGAARRNTSAYLTQALHQRFFTGQDSEPSPSETSSGALPEEDVPHATTRRRERSGGGRAACR